MQICFKKISESTLVTPISSFTNIQIWLFAEDRSLTKLLEVTNVEKQNVLAYVD